MSRAFAIIRRQILLNLLEDPWRARDYIRLVHFLLDDTKLRIKLKRAKSDEFILTLGSYQGDSLRGKFFTLYLSGAITHMRTVTKDKKINQFQNIRCHLNLITLMIVNFQIKTKKIWKTYYQQQRKYSKNGIYKLIQKKSQFPEVHISSEITKKYKEEWRSQQSQAPECAQ